jgi:hypothetical protein
VLSEGGSLFGNPTRIAVRIQAGKAGIRGCKGRPAGALRAVRSQGHAARGQGSYDSRSWAGRSISSVILTDGGRKDLLRQQGCRGIGSGSPPFCAEGRIAVERGVDIESRRRARDPSAPSSLRMTEAVRKTGGFLREFPRTVGVPPSPKCARRPRRALLGRLGALRVNPPGRIGRTSVGYEDVQWLRPHLSLLKRTLFQARKRRRYS